MSKQTSEHPNEPEAPHGKHPKRRRGRYELWMRFGYAGPWLIKGEPKWHRWRTYETMELAQHTMKKKQVDWSFCEFEIRVAD